MDILIEEYKENIWAVALEDARLEGVEIDPVNETVRYGSIYYAKVECIDTSLDAAFVNLDGDNTGIIYNKDIRYTDEDGKLCKGGNEPIGKRLHLGDMIAVQAKSAHITSENDLWFDEGKNARVSMDITIAGRYLIYCPTLRTNRISRRIRGKDLRKRLDDMVHSLENLQGFILRSSAANLQTDILEREAHILKGIWNELSDHFKGNGPALVAMGPDSIQRILGDKANNPIDRIEVVTMDHYSQIENWCSIFAPDLMTKIMPIELDNASQDLALLEYRDVLGQIETLFHGYVMLINGGNLIIQETAALTAIDVNKGSDKRSYLAINIDAAKEVARQIRLRNIGGIIIIDFLKTSKKDMDKLFKILDNETYSDPCTVQIHGFTKLGLMEVTRKRRTPSLNKRFDGIAF